jgi:hypothetical protein
MKSRSKIELEAQKLVKSVLEAYEHSTGLAEGNYGWIITKGNPEIDLDKEAGTIGPRSCKSDIERRLKAGEGKKFKMFDDDGEWYYDGRLIGGSGLEPLDDFGTPNAGCTTIKYFENGAWQDSFNSSCTLVATGDIGNNDPETLTYDFERFFRILKHKFPKVELGRNEVKEIASYGGNGIGPGASRQNGGGRYFYGEIKNIPFENSDRAVDIAEDELSDLGLEISCDEED